MKTNNRVRANNIIVNQAQGKGRAAGVGGSQYNDSSSRQ